MLEEIRKYDNLGTPEYFWEFFERLRDDSSLEGRIRYANIFLIEPLMRRGVSLMDAYLC